MINNAACFCDAAAPLRGREQIAQNGLGGGRRQCAGARAQVCKNTTSCVSASAPGPPCVCVFPVGSVSAGSAVSLLCLLLPLGAPRRWVGSDVRSGRLGPLRKQPGRSLMHPLLHLGPGPGRSRGGPSVAHLTSYPGSAPAVGKALMLTVEPEPEPEGLGHCSLPSGLQEREEGLERPSGRDAWHMALWGRTVP